MANNAYYDFLPKFNRFEAVEVVTFQNVSSPGGPYGTKRGGDLSAEQQGLLSTHSNGRIPVGYTIVAVFLGLQIIIALIILIRFLRETAVTRIGDPWQAMAQVSSDDSDTGIKKVFALSRRTNVDRSAVAKELEAKNQDRMRVGVEGVNGTVRLRRKDGTGTV
ncbi:hypothetical protein TWF694_004447 [Orbilia ellipsospora]|uniref:Uncharacterized protein n=1 Tax=Orbilia ellipsospora TaxID=2528407 RepID=A0AAV9WV56_9PEZI